MPQYLIIASMPSFEVVIHVMNSSASAGCFALARTAALEPPIALEPKPDASPLLHRRDLPLASPTWMDS